MEELVVVLRAVCLHYVAISHVRPIALTRARIGSGRKHVLIALILIIHHGLIAPSAIRCGVRTRGNAYAPTAIAMSMDPSSIARL